MSDGVLGFLVGVGAAAWVTFVIFSAVDDSKLKACAREHNIYACKFVTVPKQPDEARK